MERILTSSAFALLTSIILVLASTGAKAQHGPGYTHCEAKFVDADGTEHPDTYHQFMENCLQEYNAGMPLQSREFLPRPIDDTPDELKEVLSSWLARRMLAMGYDRNDVAAAAIQYPIAFGGWGNDQDRQRETLAAFDYVNHRGRR